MQTKLKKKISARKSKSVPKAYLQLIGSVLLAPIKTEAEYARASKLADKLASRQDALRPEEHDYFQVLCDLIERYESEHVEIPDLKADEMLRFLIEQRGVTQQTVAEESGIANSTISAVLGGSRKLTLEHINILASYFGVSPAVFLPGND